MNKLRIVVDFVLPADALQLLQEKTKEHQLILPPKPAPSVFDKAEAHPELLTADIAFGQPDPDAVAQARQLKWIQISTSSITRYDTVEFRALLAARGIIFTHSAAVYAEACATHALSFILAQARQLPRALQTRALWGSDAWDALRELCHPLEGATLLIVGYGAIGKRLAEMVRPLRMKVIAHRRSRRGDEDIAIVSPTELPQALGAADHVVNILPDSESTRRFFDASRFQQMKSGATFYNIGRGVTVDQEALLEALRTGRIGAAWLDVTVPEPLPADHPLRAEPNCFITPHVAGGYAREGLTLVRHFLDNLDRFLKAEPLLDRII
jgi:phosphoglycerate dehydrogenase-like enzyme